MREEKSGAVALIFALALIPIFLALGVTLDYSRATSAKSALQNASDAAALAAGANPAETQAQHLLLAASRAAVNLGTTVLTASCTANSCTLNPVGPLSNIVVSETDGTGTYTVKIGARIDTAVMQLANFPTLSIGATSVASVTGVSNSHPLEIALALDNTGSMAPNISALITAAQTLADTALAAAGNTGAVRVSVVPYVAAVNPGLPSLSMIDTTALSAWNGTWYTGAWVANNSEFSNTSPNTTGISPASKIPASPVGAPCVANWGSGGGTASGPGGSSSGDAGDARDILEILNPIRHLARELFGVSSAYAGSINLGVTPNTIPPLTLSPSPGSNASGSQNQTSSNYFKAGTGKSAKYLQYEFPVGFHTSLTTGGTENGGCDWLANPWTVSHYDLFPRVLNTSGQSVAWKGCVEARPTSAELAWLNSNWGGSYPTGTDYDVTDTAPTSANPQTLFVPYFWPDEPDYNMVSWAHQAPGVYTNGSGGFHNNYLADIGTASGTTTTAVYNGWGWTPSSWNAGQYILKYDATTKAAAIVETGGTAGSSPPLGVTAGPNAGCPEPLTPLTNNKTTIDNAINAMNFWYNGGTVISEGFMWAWRTLSPTTNFWNLATPPAAYNNGAAKVIVLMTDGVNGLADNGNSNSSGSSSANISDYSAYGYLGGNRLAYPNGITQYGPVTAPTSPPNDLTSFLDNRLLAACANAKAAGITVYTVLFSANISQTLAAHSQSILQQCASTPSGSYEASDAAALNTAFANIATSATAQPLHLSQ
jgi:Flp pilus assembly protein TadG